MSNAHDFIVLSAGDTSVVIDCPIGGRPIILHWGAAVGETSAEQLKALATRQHAHGSVAVEVPISLSNEIGAGGLGAPAFAAHRGGSHWAGLFEITDVGRPFEHAAVITCEDTRANIRVRHHISLHPESEIVEVGVHVENLGDTLLSLDWCAAGLLPLPDNISKLVGFTGRWANEFQTEEVPLFTGTYLRENRAGRTSHDCFPGLLVGTDHTSEEMSDCFGFHLGWSGNFRLRADRLADGRAFFQMGEYFYPGESVLEPGEIYASPTMYAAYSGAGYNKLSQNFHAHLRKSGLEDRLSPKPRPVHYNTWEAIYFDHDEERLKQLADAAAQVGAERFILDDGWFSGRRNDAAGLGDWHVSADVYPSGLGQLISHVIERGMEFGIWLEPEMVNPDSDLYRNHPDWILQVEGVPQIASRNQYVLDLTRREVADHLFQSINRLLTENDISYIKWDMNRDIHHPGSRGRAATSKQTRALYNLLDAVRAAHPLIEIESCASGGGRADYGILKRTDRVWTSDSNDALDRQIIQRGASHFFPLEILGTHVGPERCHITQRRLPMELRVATAMFGHMGMELNLLDEQPENLAVLKRGIALYKRHRALLHSGDFYRVETPANVNAVSVVSKDRREALLSWCNLTGHRETLPGRVRFVGLNDQSSYRVQLIWPDPVSSVTTPSIIDLLGLADEGVVVKGETLQKFGLQAPLMYPQSCVLYHLREEV